MSYVTAADVASPANKWKFERVMLDRGEGLGVYCIGYWDMRPVICYRWNGNSEQHKGNPVSRGYPTWMVLADEDYPVIIEIFPAAEREYARKFLNLLPAPKFIL